MNDALMMMTVLPVMAAIFLLPGVLLTLLIGERRLPLLSAVVLGYAWALTWSTFARIVGLSAPLLGIAFVTATLVLLIAVIRRREIAGRVCWRYWSWIIAACSVLLVYLFIVGPYDELPADVYQHMYYMSLEYQHFLAGDPVREVDPRFIFAKSMRHWYALHGAISWITGLPPHQLLGSAGAYHSLVLIAVVMVFALHQFSGLRWSRTAKLFAITAVALFFVLHFGISVFSYIRYYAIAPTIGAYALFLSGLVLYVDYLKGRQGLAALILSALAGLSAALIHPQQLLFLALMALIATLILAWDFKKVWQAPQQRRIIFFTIAGVVMTFALLAYAFTIRSPYPPVVPLQIPMQQIFPFVERLFIPNPTGQVYEVVTIWGVLVFLLSLRWHAELKTAVLLRAALWSLPIVIFNPVFTHFFLRFAHPEVLWRIAYMLPLAALGGFVLVRALTPLRPIGVVVAAALIFFLTPFDLRYFVNADSKFHMLQSVPEENTWRHWSDMVHYLNSFDNREQIITDPITGYVVVATTFHETRDRAKFIPIPVDYRLANKELSLKNLRRYEGMMLIVNDRPGGWSKTGQIGRHWRPDELNPARYYSDAFRSLLAKHPSAFVPLWENAGVAIYRIKLDWR